MPSIEARLVRLEKAHAGGGINIVLRTFVSPGADGPVKHPITALRTPDGGWHLTREDGESEREFLDRAYSVVPRPAHGVACLRQVL